MLAGAASPTIASAGAAGSGAPQAICQPSSGGGGSPATPSGGFHGMTPERLLDTRTTIGALGAGCTAVVDLAAVVPTQATGVALSVVAVDAADRGFVTVYPCDSDRPLASNVNPRPGQPTPNAVVLPVDASRRTCVYTSVTTNLVVDITGWFGPAGQSFHGSAPERALDTRTLIRPDGGAGPLLGGSVLRLPLASLGSIPADATGVVVNLTVTNTRLPGFLTAFPCTSARPLASTGNYEAGDTRAIQAFVGLGDGDLCIFSSMTTDLVVDVNGWFSGTDGTRAVSLTGTRVVDSRDGTGGWSTPLGAGEVRSFDPTAAGTIPVGAAAVLDVVTTDVTNAGFVTLFPCGGPLPATSSVNTIPGLDATNLAVVPLGQGGLICAYSLQPTDVVIDVAASFGGSGALHGLSVSAGALTPAFTPDGHDYGVRCNAGSNNWNVQALGVPGSTVVVGGANGAGNVIVAENDLVTITVTRADASSEQYFVRCLPHDFPDLRVSRPDDPTPGWYMTTTGFQAPAGATYALVLDDHGAPVWYHKTPSPVIDMKLAPDGNLVWTPLLGASFGSNPTGAYEEHAINGSLVRTWSTAGTPTDHHDLYPLPNGNSLMVSYHVRAGVDLTALGASYGSSATVVDGWLQEIRPDGSVAWQWHSEDHIAPTETTAQLDGVSITADIPAGHVVDLLHINSIDVDPVTGDVLVSARHLDAVFRVRRNPGQPDDGKVLWKLGGNATTSASTTHLAILADPLGGPARQHDARFGPGGHVTMFDNRTNKTTPSRAVDYLVDATAGTARLTWEYRRPDGLAAFGLGSVRRQADGSTVICWGGFQPLLTEVGPSGSVTLELTQSPSGVTYRSTKEPLATFDAAVLRANAGQ